MIKMDFKAYLLNSDGTEHERKITLAKALSELLDTETEGNAIKLFSWSKKLSKTSELELDDSDYASLKKLVEETKRQVTLVKAQVLEIIINAKDAVDKKNLAE